MTTFAPSTPGSRTPEPTATAPADPRDAAGTAGTAGTARAAHTEHEHHAPGTLTVLDPRDGTLVGDVAEADHEAVVDAVRRARAAQGAWMRTPAAARGELLQDAAAALRERADELAALNQRETGKPFDDSRGGVLAGADTLRQYAELGPLHRGLSLVGAREAADFTIDQPRGVVAAVTPWNDPVAVACGLIGAALVTGNAVVHKPSERSPHVGQLLGEIVSAVLPPDVLVTVSGGAAVGAALTEQPDVDVVAHVGSTATGRRIARVAALTGAHVVLENGGDDALIVDADVDPAWAAEQAALGAFANAGQICTSVERIYVHRDVADAFVEALVVEATRRNDRGELGPLVDGRLRDEVQRQVDDALASGARALVGGAVPSGPGSWYPATVLVDCTPHMTVVQEETFGPVAPVQVVDDFDEGLRLACAGRYGLAATVLTGSIGHANRAMAELPVGTVKINAVFGGAPGGSAQPRGESGAGFGYGPELLDEMTLTKVVHYGTPVLAGERRATPTASAGGADETAGTARTAGSADTAASASRPSPEASPSAVAPAEAAASATASAPRASAPSPSADADSDAATTASTGRTPHPQDPAEGGDPDDGTQSEGTGSEGTGSPNEQPRVHPAQPAEGD
jgi:acyl-CoA reductase-like NAD-dependent aldehyde dehydrogenase